MAGAFGKFPSLSAFLESYKAARKKRELKEALAGPLDLAVKKIKKKQKQPRNVVEVEATLAHREPDDSDASGGKHVRLLITVDKILVNDADVSSDLKDARSTGREVFVAIRIGDAMGIQEKMKGLNAGSAVHTRGVDYPPEGSRSRRRTNVGSALHSSSTWGLSVLKSNVTPNRRNSSLNMQL